MERNLTPRQEEILKKIIEEHTNLGIPVSSQILQEKYFNDLSSATIRNEMVVLEKNNLIAKNYLSSGRLPSLQGYQYYNNFLNIDSVPEKIKIKIMDILSDRNLSIDNVIAKSVELIADATSLLSIATNDYHNDLLKKIDLVIMNETTALLLIISSTGNIIKKDINIEPNINMEDVSICINVLNDRLVDTPINEITNKLEIVSDLLKTKVKTYEYIIREIVEKVFNDINWKKVYISKNQNILLQPEFHDIEKLKKLLLLLEDVSVWKQIQYTKSITGKNSINLISNLGINDVSLISTNIKLKKTSHEIALIGPNRLTHSKAQNLLEFLKKEIEERFK